MDRYCLIQPSITLNTRAVGFKNKFWPPGKTLLIGFIGGNTSQHQYVKDVIKEWVDICNINVDYDTTHPEIRISFLEGNGSWSYIGTDCLNVPSSYPTLNFGWLDEAVVLHEFGHVLGLGHEHQNPVGGIKWNVDAIIKELSGPPNYWDEETIRKNVIEPYDVDQIIGTELDKESIMMYPIPNSWTLDDFEVDFNTKLSDLDKLFISEVYPFDDVDEDDDNIKNETDVFIKKLKYVFKEYRELRRLHERVVVRIGELIGADVDIKYRKRVNVLNVWKIIHGS